jgi:hypothetical protein
MKFFGKVILLTLSLVVFAALTVCCAKSAEQQQKEANRILAADTFRSLLKIESAIEVGVNYQKYGELLIDAKTYVNEANLRLTDANIKKTFNNVIEEFSDALKIWKHKIDNSSYSFGSKLYSYSEPGKTIILKYSIPTEKDSIGSYADADGAMQVIWAKATVDLLAAWPSIQALEGEKPK